MVNYKDSLCRFAGINEMCTAIATHAKAIQAPAHALPGCSTQASTQALLYR